MLIKLPRPKARILVATVIFMVCSWATGSAALADSSPVRVGSEVSQGLFWSIEKDGDQVGYLLGTIHSEDPRVLEFSKTFLNKLNSCEVYAMEMVPDVPTLHKLTQYMNYQDGQTLEAVIGRQRFNALVGVMGGYQIPADFVNRMKPWAAMMTISTPAPKTGFFMDLSLSLRASGNGIDVVGLETLEQQLSFLENMPMEMQKDLLDQAIADVDQVAEMQTRMVDTYLENDLQLLLDMTDKELESIGLEAQQYINDNGIAQRNHRMHASLLSLLESRRVFAAVGALHLPGEEGLLTLLRHSGYQLVPQLVPFTD